MKNLAKFYSLVICLAGILLFNVSAVIAQNGNGGGVTLLSQALENGQGFTTGQGHLNGNSNIVLDCPDFETVLNERYSNPNICVIEVGDHMVEFNEMVEPKTLVAQLLTYSIPGCNPSME